MLYYQTGQPLPGLGVSGPDGRHARAASALY